MNVDKFVVDLRKDACCVNYLIVILTIPSKDLEEMKQAIEEDCGKVDESEW